MTLQRVYYELRRIRAERRQAADDIPFLGLHDLIWITGNLKATDPRDKLYALLGVDEAQDVQVLVDYTRSIQEVYIDFAISYITTKQSLGILVEAGIGFGVLDPDLPS